MLVMVYVTSRSCHLLVFCSQSYSKSTRLGCGILSPFLYMYVFYISMLSSAYDNIGGCFTPYILGYRIQCVPHGGLHRNPVWQPFWANGSFSLFSPLWRFIYNKRSCSYNSWSRTERLWALLPVCRIGYFSFYGRLCTLWFLTAIVEAYLLVFLSSKCLHATD